MVHSLCRAGTVSASLLNGNQQVNPASGPADDKGKAESLQQRQGSREICTQQRRNQAKERAAALKKMSVPKSAIAAAIFREQT